MTLNIEPELDKAFKAIKHESKNTEVLANGIGHRKFKNKGIEEIPVECEVRLLVISAV